MGDTVLGAFLHINEYGHLKLSGSGIVYKDAVADLIQATSQGVGVSVDPVEGTLDFVDTAQIASDYAYGNSQLNHDRQHAGDVYPHLHWFQTSSGEPNWLFQYRWQVNGQPKWENWSGLPTLSGVFEYAGTAIMQISPFGAITPPAASNVSDIVQFRLCRDTDNDSALFTGSDGIAGDVQAISLDIHYPVDSIGSDEEYTKDPA